MELDPDFVGIIKDLQADGYTKTQIAAFAGVEVAVINNIIKGNTKSVKYSVGARLIELWDNGPNKLSFSSAATTQEPANG